jgi:hypothetical protein
MKVIVLMLVAVCFVSLTACGRIYGPVEQSKALMEARDDIISHWSKSIKENPTESGIDEARKYFDSKKADITVKRDAVQSAPQGMNSDWRTNLFTHEIRTNKELDAIETYVMGGPAYTSADKFKTLRKEFEAIYR